MGFSPNGAAIPRCPMIKTTSQASIFPRTNTEYISTKLQEPPIYYFTSTSYHVKSFYNRHSRSSVLPHLLAPLTRSAFTSVVDHLPTLPDLQGIWPILSILGQVQRCPIGPVIMVRRSCWVVYNGYTTVVKLSPTAKSESPSSHMSSKLSSRLSPA